MSAIDVNKIIIILLFRAMQMSIELPDIFLSKINIKMINEFYKQIIGSLNYYFFFYYYLQNIFDIYIMLQ